MFRLWIVLASLLVLLTFGGRVFAADPKADGDKGHGQMPQACTEMMSKTQTTEEGRKAMDEFMRSDKAPQAMANMMEMAKRMGNGDVMLGMTKMMEMMGGGGMMGHQGVMMPGAGQPGK